MLVEVKDSFLPSTVWVPGIELRSSDLEASIFTQSHLDGPCGLISNLLIWINFAVEPKPERASSTTELQFQTIT